MLLDASAEICFEIFTSECDFAEEMLIPSANAGDNVWGIFSDAFMKGDVKLLSNLVSRRVPDEDTRVESAAGFAEVEAEPDFRFALEYGTLLDVLGGSKDSD